MAVGASFMSGFTAPIWNWFADNALPWIGTLLRGLLEWFLGPVISFLLPVAKIVTLVIAALELIAWALTVIIDSMSLFDLSGFVKPDAALLTYGLFIDRFVPLHEAFAFAILLFFLWQLVTLMRWVRYFFKLLPFT